MVPDVLFGEPLVGVNVGVDQGIHSGTVVAIHEDGAFLQPHRSTGQLGPVGHRRRPLATVLDERGTGLGKGGKGGKNNGEEHTGPMQRSHGDECTATPVSSATSARTVQGSSARMIGHRVFSNACCSPFTVMRNSTRRFWLRPSSVLLLAMGWFLPWPTGIKRSGVIPFCRR